MASVKIIECPRDAMQGIKEFIPTSKKIEYLNALLKVGFQTLDCGSFVSSASIPQMADTKIVISRLKLDETDTNLSVIVGNKRGAEDACEFDEITYLGYPFSISETFQQRNTNCSIEDSLLRVDEIMNIAECAGKTFVCYISMAFGNPYGDLWNVEIVEHWTAEMDKLGVKIISLSDTIGVADPGSISYLFNGLIPAFPHIEFGAHLHTQPHNWKEKIHAAYSSGCRRFDGAIKGFGGCPMAADELTGNMPTEHIISYLNEHGINSNMDINAFHLSVNRAVEVFV